MKKLDENKPYPLGDLRTLEAGKIKRIHVNQHHIRWNAKNKKSDWRPTVTVKTSSENIKGYHVKIYGESEVVYSPEKPLSCGAKMWIETKSEVTVVKCKEL